MKQFLQLIFYSFPMQLLLLNIRKNKVLLAFWLILFGIVTQQIGRIFGISYLFLDPEYVNQVGFGSLFIMGLAIGGFTMAFHISCYILDSRKFVFLGSLRRPITRFCINNSPIPFVFVLVYLLCFVRFQLRNELLSVADVLWQASGLVLGFVTMILVIFYYLVLTNRDLFKTLASQLGRGFKRRRMNRVNVMLRINDAKKDLIRVDTYFESLIRVRKVNPTAPYENRVILKMFDQNYLNAIVMEIVVVASVLVLGFFRDNPVFQIPAGASLVLLFTIVVMLRGAVSYWLKGWSVTIGFLLLFVVNYLVANDYFRADYEAYGLNYGGKKAEYSMANLRTPDGPERYEADKEHTVGILSRWRAGFPADRPPKMVFVCTSGGGQRAAVWTMRTLQYADSALEGRLMRHTRLMTGASGGLVGASFFRELCLRKNRGDSIRVYDDRFLTDVARDNLNAIVFSLVVNDIFFRFQKFTYQGRSYHKDRGYAFEEQLNKNTDGMLDKPLSDYYEPERQALIPMLIMAPTVINDGRKLFISPQPVSYMTIPGTVPQRVLGTAPSFYSGSFRYPSIQGIEFGHFFAEQDAHRLRFLSALRMSATFPYITPNVQLPSEPAMEIMDAGLSDNFGISDAVRFLHVFKDWIAQNTSGVVFVCIRDTPKNPAIAKNVSQSLFQKVFTPIGSFYANWEHLQDINNDNSLEFAQTWFRGRIDRVELEYIPHASLLPVDDSTAVVTDAIELDKVRAASLSWHLTGFEKESIRNAILEEHNQRAIRRLQALLKDPMAGENRLQPGK
ncbi:MAG: patatin-like phospholipase family protein [Ferruginibacter sp.]|nr:patatin-like phospholipase family protein [Cytophagales bacterium]